ncbi:MAG: V-type ATP synthase subunit K [Phycisphaerae bacterium]|nr:V-type ATP synthase subunit K [Phycisphaerae bacterium]
MAQIGAAIALGLAAFGSAIGIGTAGCAAAGAWAKEGKANKTLSFTYIILLGLPISQTLYAMIIMNKMSAVYEFSDITASNAGVLFGLGIAVGIAEMLSAWMQGKAAAAGIRGLSDSDGKGFAFILITLGVVETVGIFAMVFLMKLIPTLPEVAEGAETAMACLGM